LKKTIETKPGKVSDISVKSKNAIEYLQEAIADAKVNKITDCIVIVVREKNKIMEYGHSRMPATQIIGLLEITKNLVVQENSVTV